MLKACQQNKEKGKEKVERREAAESVWTLEKLKRASYSLLAVAAAHLIDHDRKKAFENKLNLQMEIWVISVFIWCSTPKMQPNI